MIPVTVRLANANADVHVTQKLSGLSWRSVVPGGFASATFQLQQPIDFTSPMLAPFTRVYVYDGRSGDTLWEGRLAMPGRSAGDQGQVWSLTAIGPAAHALDQTAPLIYIDTGLEGWQRSNIEPGGVFRMPAGATVSNTNHPDTALFDVVLCQFPSGTPVANSFRVAAIYDGFIGTGMEIGVIGFSWDAGFTSSSWHAQLGLGSAYTVTEIPMSATGNVAGGTYVGWVGADFTSGKDFATVRLVNSTAGTVSISDDLRWVSFANIRVLGQRFTKAGLPLTGSGGMPSSVYVRASWVVADLLGRMLPQYDGPNANLSASDTVDIDQLTYTDAVTPSTVLEDLMKLEPDTYWAAWESDATTGKYQFEWVNWDSEPRYEVSVEDGFDSPAPTFEVYNSVKVRYRDVRGRTRTVTQAQAVESLDAHGIIREWFEDLSDEVGSAANALSFAVNFLADHAAPSSGGTLTVSRPVRDVLANRRVDPWQIMPGELVTVRGIEASQEVTGNPTRDGVTTFRIVSVQADSDGTATLELDMFTPTESRALANVAKRRLRKR